MTLYMKTWLSHEKIHLSYSRKAENTKSVIVTRKNGFVAFKNHPSIARVII